MAHSELHAVAPSVRGCRVDKALQEAELQGTHACTAGAEPVWWLCFFFFWIIIFHFPLALCQECTFVRSRQLLSSDLLPFQRNKLFVTAGNSV